MASGDTQALAERLRERRDEIEQALLTRVYAISHPIEVGDREYALGLRAAVTAALDYALESLGAGERHRPRLPPELLSQARAAARAGIDLDTVLRRYFAGYTLLTDCLVREARGGGGGDLVEPLRSQAELFDRLVTAIASVYTEEAGRRYESAEHRRAEMVRRLLEGELLDANDLGYPLEGWHLAIAATGLGVSKAIRGVAQASECRLLLVRPADELAWAWLGSRRPLEPDAVRRGISLPTGTALSLGEPAGGPLGWRSSHRQAAAALPVAQRAGERTVRYTDVALVAAALRDEVLAHSLRDLYLAPLRGEPDGGEALRRTARAYFAAGRNVSAAAAALKVSRPTVNSRLRAIEELTGRSPERWAAQMETALALDRIAEGGAAIPQSRFPDWQGKRRPAARRLAASSRQYPAA